MLDALITGFGAIEDPRDPCRVEHRLIDILVIAVCAVLGQAESFEDMADYGRCKEAWLRGFLALPNGIPSHDTFRRIFLLIDPDAFERVFLAWVRSVFAPGETEPDQLRQVAVDGKTLRHFRDRGKGWHPLRLVSAYATEHGITLGQAAVPPGAGERAAVPALLDGLDLTGCLGHPGRRLLPEGDRPRDPRPGRRLPGLPQGQPEEAPRRGERLVRPAVLRPRRARPPAGARQRRRRPRPPGAPARVRLPRARRPAGPAGLAGRAGRARGRGHPRPPPGPLRDHARGPLLPDQRRARSRPARPGRPEPLAGRERPALGP